MKQELGQLIEKDRPGCADNDSQACCDPVLVAPILPIAQAKATAELFAALADPTRLTILSLIARSEQREVCVCDITASFKLGQPTISHHLKILRDVDLIKGDKRGKWVYYSLVEGRAEQVKEWLDAIVKVPVLT